ncbi:hypothetical protein [Desulfofalx alkaliphila]|uniref:hypothetical protein n=1 Tax=Desulfofalx alkaliphila TaxID=105483 RepID=UPI0004E2049A|nr:hypothetical protein [Desulfofalx alkaliphila]
MKKKVYLLKVILLGVVALIWTILAIFDVIDGTSENSISLLIMKTLCAVTWFVVFAMYLHRYRTGQKV